MAAKLLRFAIVALSFGVRSPSSRPVAAAGNRRKRTPRPENRSASSQTTFTSGARIALGELLLARELITVDQLNAAIEQQGRDGRRIGQILIESGATTADAVLGALSVQLGMPSTRINAYTLNAEALRALPEKVARKHRAFPIEKIGTTLTVALAAPADLEMIDDLRFASGCEIRTLVAMEDEITGALDRYYAPEGIPHQLAGPAEQVVVESPLIERRDPSRSGRRAEMYGRRATDLVETDPERFDEAAEKSAVTILDRLLARAATDCASDLHLESLRDAFRVRFRIDGTFREVATFDPVLAPAIVARVKVLSGMDIAEHRLPQDGRFSATVGSRRLDIRSATYPTLHGEKAVLRLLDRSTLRLRLETMGMRGALLERFRELIRKPEGMILMTGPTGSGKTSTLYAALAELVETGKHIITIEDPVEYALAGVNQGQTNDKAGFTFARGLRAILRQDPDVIMVGEIRDRETLQTAVEASLTGHLVFSTLHTNGALATVARMVDMGVEPYLLASSLLSLAAQRLVRRICATCRSEMPTPPGVNHLFPSGPPDRLYRGRGCHDCHGTGYRGRVAIHELAVMTDELRHLIMERAPESRLKEAASRSGMVSLRDECLTRVIEGETTLEEVLRVTQERA
jgi:type IV pilus assembly protein PilB